MPKMRLRKRVLARCLKCRNPIAEPIGTNVHYLEYDGSLNLDPIGNPGRGLKDAMKVSGHSMNTTIELHDSKVAEIAVRNGTVVVQSSRGHDASHPTKGDWEGTRKTIRDESQTAAQDAP